MTDQHPITPPPKLTDIWKNLPLSDEKILVIAARWGADQELEACANWLADPCAADMPSLAKDLRYSRRPKPPSLKEQALSELDSLENMGACNADTIRRALEQLDD